MNEENGHMVRIDKGNDPYECTIYRDEDGELIVRLRRGDFCRNYRVDSIKVES